MSIMLVALDIGGVLATIDKSPLIELLGDRPENSFFDQDFFLLERGFISPEFFLQKKCHSLKLCPKALHFSFSTMMQIPATSFCLKYLKVPYLFASNINEMHYHNVCSHLHPPSFAVKNAHLSCRLGFLKPHAHFFWLLANALLLTPKQILFIDDKKQNCESAKNWGFKVQWCKNVEALPSLLGTLKLLR